jgi:HKD family nuclease
MKGPVTFAPITNKKKSSTGRSIGDLLADPELLSADMASAYLSHKGWKVLYPALEKAILARGRKIRLLVSTKDSFTDPEALEAAQRLSKTSGKHKTKDKHKANDKLFQVRLSRNPRFHAKAYLFEFPQRTTVIIGSANLTSQGLRTDGELSLRIDVPSGDPSVQGLRAWFTQEFENGRVVDPILLNAYRRARPKNAGKAPRTSAARQSFLKALRAVNPESDDSDDTSPEEKRVVWQASIHYAISDRSEHRLERDADWYRGSEPEFICHASRPRAFEDVKENDKVLVFDFTDGKRNGWARPATVIETNDYPRTDDGRYFLVLRYSKKGRKRLSRNYKGSLVDRGFAKSGSALTKILDAPLRRMGKSQLQVAKDDFGVPLGLTRR